ncbi:hypothetical protein MKY96_33785 [Paenibacillus sp. FSL R7-0302]|uniref:hypothetical protein n=1 Tax=Paenibacillus sp. FSL R7-0302 TaxID=2921681 RepID=UPI0030F9F414
MWTPFSKPTETPQQASQPQQASPKQERLVTLIMQTKELLPPAASMLIPNSTLQGFCSRLDDDKIDEIVAHFKQLVEYVDQGGPNPLESGLFGE